MKTSIHILLFTLSSICVFGQDTIRYDILSNEVPNPYWYDYSKKDNRLRTASHVSFAAGGTLIAIGLIRSAANSTEVGLAKARSAMVNFSGQVMTGGLSYAAQSQVPAWDPVDYLDFHYNDSRSTKQYFISGSALLGLGVILTLIDQNSGSVKRQNSKRLYKYLRASSTGDSISVTCKF